LITTNPPTRAQIEPPKLVPYSKGELASREGQTVGPLGPKPLKIECPHCNEYKGNSDASKLRLHLFHHYKDRWESRVDTLEKGHNYFYCDSCPKRKQLRGGNEEGARLSAICHFAIQHHELREVLKRDDSLSDNFINELYWDIDSKPKDNLPIAAVINSHASKTVKPEGGQVRKQTPKVPEPTRGRRPKGNNRSIRTNGTDENSKSIDAKAEWISSGEEEDEAPPKSRNKRKNRA